MLRCEKEMSKHFAFLQIFSQTDQITEEMGNKDLQVGKNYGISFKNGVGWFKVAKILSLYWWTIFIVVALVWGSIEEDAKTTMSQNSN